MIGLIAVLGACDDGIPAKLEFDQFKKLYLSAASNEPKTVKIHGNIDTSFVLGNIAYGGTTDFKQGGVTAEIAVDFSLVATYNAEHNTAFEPLPEGSFSFDKTSLVIENGKNHSEVVQLFVTPGTLVDEEQTYMLPVTIKSVTGNVPINENRKTAYWIFSFAPIVELCEKTRWSVVDFSSNHGGDNVVAHAIDGNYQNRWHSQDDPRPHFITIDMSETLTIVRFGIWPSVFDRPAGEADPRMPSKIRYEVSNDNVNWTSVGEFPYDNSITNLEGRFFDITPVVARYFRLTSVEWTEAPMVLGELDVYVRR
jgi:hypothetical protein